MKGQFLFVRPETPDDRDSLGAFHVSEGRVAPVEGDGFVGKLAGDVVAHARCRRAGHTLEIAGLWVASRLRRKRVGASMIREIERIARETGVTRLEIAPECRANEFFGKVGFEVRDGELVKEWSDTGARN